MGNLALETRAIREPRIHMKGIVVPTVSREFGDQIRSDGDRVFGSLADLEAIYITKGHGFSSHGFVSGPAQPSRLPMMFDDGFGDL